MSSQFKTFNPPVRLSESELLRLLEYSRNILPPSRSRDIIVSISPPPPDDDDAMSGTFDSSYSAPATSHRATQEPGQSDNNSGGGDSAAAGESIAMEALHANDLAREAAFTHLFDRDEPCHIFLDSDDGSDDDEDWEDNMDPLTFARYYAGPANPHFVKMVQDHDRETRAQFDRDMKSWSEGVAMSGVR